MELSLERTIGNYDQEFFENWCTNLNKFSFILMKDIVKFCEKAIEETAKGIDKFCIGWKLILHKSNFV